MQHPGLALTIHSLATAALVVAAVRCCYLPRVPPIELTVWHRNETTHDVDVQVGMWQDSPVDETGEKGRGDMNDTVEKIAAQFLGTGLDGRSVRAVSFALTSSNTLVYCCEVHATLPRCTDATGRLV